MADIIRKVMGTGTRRAKRNGRKSMEKRLASPSQTLSQDASVQEEEIEREVSETMISGDSNIEQQISITDSKPPASKPRRVKKKSPPSSIDRSIKLGQPYIAIAPIPDNAGTSESEIPNYPPPYPPILSNQTKLFPEQKREIYRRPLVDLRRETFTPYLWKQSWMVAEKEQLPNILEALAEEKANEEKANEEKSNEENAKDKKEKKGKKVDEKGRKKIQYITLEGPKDLPPGKKGRRIKRYRVLDSNGNEILLYINTKAPTKWENNPFGTEIETEYRKRLTPYVPGSREIQKPRMKVMKPKHPLDQKIRKDLEGRSKSTRLGRLRFQSVGPPRKRIETAETKALEEERKTLNLGHPQRFKSACFTACWGCDIVKYQGVPVSTTNPLHLCCSQLCCRCIPAVDFISLFGSCPKKEDPYERIDSPENVGFSPGPILGYIDRADRPSLENKNPC